MGLPLYVLPCGMVGRFSWVMRFLRLYLNRYHVGLFALGAMMSHSCSPNAERYTREDGMSAVLSSYSIRAGEEISIHYTNLIHMRQARGGRFVRRCFLFTKMGFCCQCSRCTGTETQTKAKLLAKARTANFN